MVPCITTLISSFSNQVLFVSDVTKSWSDYELWWPKHSQWLDKMGQVLGKYEVQADALLLYTPKHKVRCHFAVN